MSWRIQSAAGSLAEGLDETLTLHRLGVYGVLGRSLKTTNGLESMGNAVPLAELKSTPSLAGHCAPGHRAAPRKVMGYRHLPKLRDALKRELKIDTTTSKKKAA